MNINSKNYVNMNYPARVILLWYRRKGHWVIVLCLVRNRKLFWCVTKSFTSLFVFLIYNWNLFRRPGLRNDDPRIEIFDYLFVAFVIKMTNEWTTIQNFHLHQAARKTIFKTPPSSNHLFRCSRAAPKESGMLQLESQPWPSSNLQKMSVNGKSRVTFVLEVWPPYLGEVKTSFHVSYIKALSEFVNFHQTHLKPTHLKKKLTEAQSSPHILVTEASVLKLVWLYGI